MYLAYFGHHKCATQYIKAVLSEMARWLGRGFGVARGSGFGGSFVAGDELNLRVYGRERFAGPELPLDIIPGMLFFPNANGLSVTALTTQGSWRGFHVIRDPRDVVVSGYFSHLYSHGLHPDGAQQILDWRQQLAAAPTLEDGLLLELEFEAWNFANMASFDDNHPAIYELRYEQMINDHLSAFRQIAKYLDISVPTVGLWSSAGIARDWLLWKSTGCLPAQRDCLPQPVLRYILYKNAFERKAGKRRPGEEDAKHHYRKGIAGDWRNHFTPRLKDAFKQRYGDLLIQLGYEQTSDW
jgi:hypothetical protein